MRGRAELRQAVERMDDVTLDVALEAAIAGRFDFVERLIAAAAPPVAQERRRVIDRRPVGVAGVHPQRDAVGEAGPVSKSTTLPAKSATCAPAN